MDVMAEGKPVVDYSVYLVTDSTPAILGADRSVEDVVEAALRSPQGSIGIVQLRDKLADARALLATLARLHQATTAAGGVPLLLNDRVDVAAVAMAAGTCEGVHLGQDDVDVATARALLPPRAIVGATASTPAEAVAACRAGADYLGLGTVFATPTKTNTKHVVGTSGIQAMLQAMAAAGFGHVPAVCIGGINADNARRVVFQSGYGGDGNSTEMAKPLDGVAVVSAIMAAKDPAAAAAALAERVRLGKTEGPTDFYRVPAAGERPPLPAKALSTSALRQIVHAVHMKTPLSHNMTNLVVQNIAANVALAVGASPIMSNSGAEATDLARIPGSALVVNMGTVTPESLANYVQAIRAYNAAGRPIIFDPVGAGATAVRRAAVSTILSAGYIDVIKGNEGEIQAVYLSGLGEAEREQEEKTLGQQRGVDGSNRLGTAERAELARKLARRERCVVVLTGAVDVVSDGRRLATVDDGHPLMGSVTGIGCSLGTVLSATVAVTETFPPYEEAGDVFSGVVAGLQLYERAAARAAASPAVQGPGSFVPALLDELYRCRHLAAEGDMSWSHKSPVA